MTSAPVTAVPATLPPHNGWDSVPSSGPGTHLGPWVLRSRFEVLAALAGQGLAVVKKPGQGPVLVFRGSLSIPPRLARLGWDHAGDPGGWHGYLFDAYQHALPASAKLFEVTTPSGRVVDFVHPLAPGEMANNSFAAISPDGKWLVSGEWGEMTRLLVFPTPMLNEMAPASNPLLPLAAEIELDHPVRDVQGCTFTSATQLLCSTDDPGTDLWPTPDQLLRIDLPAPLDGRSVTARVSSLGELPLFSRCSGTYRTYEVEGISYQRSDGVLRVEVRPPGRCGLAITVYDYQRSFRASAPPTLPGGLPAPAGPSAHR